MRLLPDEHLRRHLLEVASLYIPHQRFQATVTAPGPRHFKSAHLQPFVQISPMVHLIAVDEPYKEPEPYTPIVGPGQPVEASFIYWSRFMYQALAMHAGHMILIDEDVLTFPSLVCESCDCTLFTVSKATGDQDIAWMHNLPAPPQEEGPSPWDGLNEIGNPIEPETERVLGRLKAIREPK